MDRSFVSHLLAAACAAAVFAPGATAQVAVLGGLPVATAEAQDPQTKPRAANPQVRLAEVMAMLEEDALSPEQRKQALAKLAEVQAQLARQAAAPRAVAGGLAAPSAAGEKVESVRSLGVPMPAAGLSAQAAPSAPRAAIAPVAPTAPTPPAAPSAPTPPRAFSSRAAKAPAAVQVETVEVPAGTARAVVVERKGEQVVDVVRSETFPGERRIYTTRAVPGMAPIVVESAEGAPLAVTIRSEAAKVKHDEEVAVVHERAARAAEQARVHVEQARKFQIDAERMRVAADAQRQAAKQFERFAPAKERRTAFVETAPEATAPAEHLDLRVIELQDQGPAVRGIRGRSPNPARSGASAEGDVRATIDELRSELQAIRALLQDVRRQVEQEDRAVPGQGMGSSEAVKSARVRAGR